MTTTATLELPTGTRPVRVTTDHDDCQACGRTGLLRVVVLATDTREVAHVGTECMKKLMGWAPKKSDYDWTTDYHPIAEHVEDGRTFVLWQHNRGARTAMTRDAHPIMFGGALTDWTGRGWAV